MSERADKRIDVEWLRRALSQSAEDLAVIARAKGSPRELRRRARPILGEIFRWEGTDPAEQDTIEGIALLRRADHVLAASYMAEQTRFAAALGRRLGRLWPISIPCVFAREIGQVAQLAEGHMERREERIEAVLATLHVDVEGFLAAQQEVSYRGATAERKIVEKRARK